MSCCFCQASCSASIQTERQFASVFRSKCGYPEFETTEGEPPKLYLTTTGSYSVVTGPPICECPPEDPEEEFVPGSLVGSSNGSGGGSKSIDPEDCTESYDNEPFDITISFCGEDPDEVFSISASLELGLGYTVDSPTSASYTDETVVDIPEGCPDSQTSITSGSLTLSEEYTTAMLILAAEEELEDEDLGEWVIGSPSASRNLSETEAGVALSKSKYRLRVLPMSPSCKVRLEWDEIFTPENGDPPTLTGKAFNWSGSGSPCTSGIDPEDPDTWPTTPAYDMDTPPENGVRTIGNFVITCP